MVVQRVQNKMVLVYLGLGVAMLSWGSLPIFQKQLLSTLTPVEVSFSRFFITAILLDIWVLCFQWGEVLRLLKNDLKWLLLSTVIGPLMAMVLFNFGILTVAVGIASVILTLEPVFTYIFAIFFGQDSWNYKKMLSILLAFAGISMVIMSGESGSQAYLGGIVLLITCSLVWAMNTVITKKIVSKYSPLVLMAASFLISSLFLFPILQDNYWNTLITMDSTLWGALLFCVGPGTILSFSVWYWCLKHVSSTSISLSLYLIPVVTIVGGVLIFDETITLLMVFGVMVTMLGLYLVTKKYVV